MNRFRSSRRCLVAHLVDRFIRSRDRKLYWPTGNPYPDDEGRDRPGDNLYTDSVLALNAKTGELKWHYQFTPHDLLDRDATEPMVLVDTGYKGTPRKLLLHADRNGFSTCLTERTANCRWLRLF